MPQVMSNDDVKKMEIYGGIAAGAGLVGLAYGVDAASPLYNDWKKKAKAAAKDQAVADAVATNEVNQSKKARERLERGSRHDGRVYNVNKAHKEALGINNQMNADAAIIADNRDRNMAIRDAQNNAPQPMTHDEERWVKSGLAQSEDDLRYLRNSDPSTVQVMEDAHWYRQNKHDKMPIQRFKNARKNIVRAVSKAL